MKDVNMNITEAEKRCEELIGQISAIKKEYDFGGWAKHCGQIKTKPLIEELNNLLLAIIKAKGTTQIEI